MSVRRASEADVAAIGAIAEASELFPAEALPEIIAPGLAGEVPDIWLVAEAGGAVVGFAYARPEEMAEDVWNILAFAVAPAARGTGHATALLHEMEGALDTRMILIETTQLEAQAAARAFYTKEGYVQEAAIADYYQPGEDKLVYVKRCAP